MMSNVWMTSDGLDINFDDTTEEVIKVHLGSIEGTFISYEQNKNKLHFQTGNIKGAFEGFSKKLGSAQIQFGDFSYTIEWDHYNYKVANGSNHTVFVTIEDREQ